MPASQEVRFQIGADTSALSKGFDRAAQIAGTASNVLKKRFNFADVFKSTVISLGVGVESISEKLAAFLSGGSVDSWKTALDAANETARVIEEQTTKRLSTVRQIAELEKQIKRDIEAGAENSAPRTSSVTVPGQFNLFTGRATPATTVTKATETSGEALARATAATNRRLIAEGRIRELQEKEAENLRRIADARRALDNVGAEGMAKYRIALDDATRAGDRLVAARKAGTDTAALELEFLARMKGAKELLAADFQRTEELMRQQDEASALAALEIAGATELEKFEARKVAIEKEYLRLKESGALSSEIQANRGALQAIEDEAALWKRTNDERVNDIKRATQLEQQLTAIELAGGDELASQRARLIALRKEEEVIKKRTGENSPELEKNRGEQVSVSGRIAVLRKSVDNDRQRSIRDAGAAMAGARPDLIPQPRLRGRSERERIADRGAALMQRADIAERRGSSPDYVARLRASAEKDFAKAGREASAASKPVTSDQMQNALKFLDSIATNLTPKQSK